MKISYFLCLSLAVLGCSHVSAQSELRLKWGIESKYHKEKQATAEQNSVNKPKTRQGEKLYRYFTPEGNSIYSDVSEMMYSRHWKLWDMYQKTLKKDQKPSKTEYLKFAKERDPYFLGLTEKLAPVLYFDWTLAKSGRPNPPFSRLFCV